jgi:pimeloyl-ACP methyl ester carboxylesterase
MIEEISPAVRSDPQGPTQPCYFGDPSRAQFGWFHEADLPGRPAVVLCPPYGLETLSAHRTLRELALRLANDGYPSLRFDYVATGDSVGAELDDADAVPVLCDSIHRAIDAARARFGVTQVVVVGFRLSTLLATAVATARDDVCGLVAIAPPPSGRAYIRESRMFGGGAQRADAGYTGLVMPEGFRISEASCVSISALKWPTALPAGLRAAFVVDRDDIPAAKACADALSQAGAACRYEVLPGVPGMLATPYEATVPAQIIDAVLGWLNTSIAPAQSALRPATRLSGAASAAGVVAAARLPGPTGGGIVERPVRIGSDPALSGILSEPANTRAGEQRQGLLVLDRVGTGRIWVHLARRRAERGDIVVRVNMAGTGDSELRPGRDDMHMYDEDNASDVATVVAWMRANLPIDRCAVVGLCAGAYHALNAILLEAPIDTVYSVNQVIYQWVPGMSLDPTKADIGHLILTKNASRSATDIDQWKRLLRGEIDLVRHSAAMVQHAMDLLGKAFGPLLRPLGLGRAEDISVAKLRAATSRHTSLRLIFSSDDPGFARMNVRASHILPELQRTGRFSMDVMTNTDHTFTTRESQQRFFELLDGYLDSSQPAATNQGSPAPAIDIAVANHA